MGFAFKPATSSFELAARFWPKVDRRGDDDCWLWTAALNDTGYGVIGRGGRGKGNWRAHHVSWILHYGLVPSHQIVRHMCESLYTKGDITCRRCVNPSHLRLGTFLDNTHDCIAAGRASKPPMRRGGENNMAKFGDELIAEAQTMLRSGASRREVRVSLGISKTHVGRIARGEHQRGAL